MNNYNDIIQRYKNKEIDFKIELSLARKFLLNGTNDSNKFTIWSTVNSIILPIFIIIISFIKLGFLWGIIFGIVYFIFYIDITGLSSVNFSKAEFSMCIFASIFLILFFMLKIKNLAIPFLVSITNFISIYCFYANIGKTIINNYILKDEKIFKFLFENNVFIIC